ncbi:MAG: biotin attachment protein [Ruminiclostridium sp.]|nr:biotin attachment protein [Ruminiclostridium sp.]
MATRIVMPPLGETMDEGKIIQWLKKEGDKVERGEALLEVETDKVTMEVEAFGSGILRKIIVEEGKTVPVGELLGIIANLDEDIINL